MSLINTLRSESIDYISIAYPQCCRYWKGLFLNPVSWLRHSVISRLNKGRLEANVSHLRLQNILKMSRCRVAGGQNQSSEGGNLDSVTRNPSHQELAHFTPHNLLHILTICWIEMSRAVISCSWGKCCMWFCYGFHIMYIFNFNCHTLTLALSLEWIPGSQLIFSRNYSNVISSSGVMHRARTRASWCLRHITR